jgi:hypothetical protein
MKRRDLLRYAFPVCILGGIRSFSFGMDVFAEQDSKSSYSFPDGGELIQSHLPYLLNGEAVIIDKACVAFEGVIISPNLFLRLQRRNTSKGWIFRVGHEVVKKFPEEVRLLVSANTGVTCSSREATDQFERISPVPTVLKSIHPEAGYIREMRLHPLEISLEEQGRNLSSGGILAPVRSTEGDWYYRFAVKTKGIPLTDPLVITMLSREGMKLAHLTYRA